MTSYIKILQKLDAFCTAHLQIKKFMGEFREQMPNFSTMDERYPIVFASPISDVEDLNTNQFTLEIYCVDIIQKDRANLNTIVSDCHLILKDLFIYYRDDNDADLDVVGTASISFVNNFDLDYVAGAVMTITFEVAGYGSCEIPMSPITPVTNDCEPATLIVRDSDDNVLYTLTVDSGSTETQTIADSTYLVEYENGTPIESGSILAEGSAVIQVPNPIVCADAVVNVNSVFFDNVASGGTLNIEVRKSSGSDLVGSKQGQYWRIADSTAVLKTTGGATISTTSIKAEESEDITAPDALVRFRYANITTGATFTDLYPIVSGGEKFLYIENSLAQLARAVVDATRPVTTYRLRDSAITLKNTANATISTTNVPATVNQDITAPDATVENSNATYTDSVASGGTLVLPDITVTDSDGSTYTQPSVENVVCTLSPDTSLEVNGTPEGTFAAGSTIEVNITDGVNPVTPNDVTVVGDVVTIEVPAATAAPVGATLMKTGQTTSYRTGDDGDLEAGRATDFFTLASNNPFGNTNRFTDELGGSTYTNDWVIDWSTYNGATVLGYFRVVQGLSTWDIGIDNATTNTYGTFSGGRMWNRTEALNILNMEVATARLNYTPFNYTTNTNFMTSTTQPLLTTSVFGYANLSGVGLSRTKTGTSAYIVVRTFTVTGTTLT